MSAHRNSFPTPTEWRALRRAFLWTALILVVIGFAIGVASQPRVVTVEKSHEVSVTELKTEAYRQNKPLGSAFSTPHNRTAIASVVSRQCASCSQVP